MSTTAARPTTAAPAAAEAATTTSNPSDLTQSPSLPARPTALTNAVPTTSSYSPYGATNSYNSPYGSYGGYGSGGGMYGNSYGGGTYGNSYGGGGMYGGGMYGGGAYGGGGMYGGGMYGNRPGGGMDPNDSLRSNLENSTAATFQLIESMVGAFGGFAQMLNSTYMATHSSFFAMMSVAEQFAHLRNSLGSILGVFAILKWFKRLLARASGGKLGSSSASINAQSFAKFQAKGANPMAAGPRPSFKPLLFFLAAVFGMPYLLNKVIRALASQQEQKQQQFDANGKPLLTDAVSGTTVDPSKLEFCRALYDFVPENPQVELEMKKGDLIAIMAKTDPLGKQSDWWRVRTRDGRTGYVPSTYVEIITRRIEPVQDNEEHQPVDEIEAQKAKNKAQS